MENIEKAELLTTGKAKSLYESNESDYLIMHYRDDTSAFDGKKIESLDGKGTINNKFNAFIMEYLEGGEFLLTLKNLSVKRIVWLKDLIWHL